MCVSVDSRMSTALNILIVIVFKEQLSLALYTIFIANHITNDISNAKKKIDAKVCLVFLLLSFRLFSKIAGYCL